MSPASQHPELYEPQTTFSCVDSFNDTIEIFVDKETLFLSGPPRPGVTITFDDGTADTTMSFTSDRLENFIQTLYHASAALDRLIEDAQQPT